MQPKQKTHARPSEEGAPRDRKRTPLAGEVDDSSRPTGNDEFTGRDWDAEQASDEPETQRGEPAPARPDPGLEDPTEDRE